MTGIFSLTGYVEEVSSKRGIRFVKFGATTPYEHSVWIEVEGDPGREDDDSLTEDLYPFCGSLVTVQVAQAKTGQLLATPASFASCDTHPKGGEKVK